MDTNVGHLTGAGLAVHAVQGGGSCGILAACAVGSYTGSDCTYANLCCAINQPTVKTLLDAQASRMTTVRIT